MRLICGDSRARIRVLRRQFEHDRATVIACANSKCSVTQHCQRPDVFVAGSKNTSARRPL